MDVTLIKDRGRNMKNCNMITGGVVLFAVGTAFVSYLASRDGGSTYCDEPSRL